MVAHFRDLLVGGKFAFRSDCAKHKGICTKYSAMTFIESADISGRDAWELARASVVCDGWLLVYDLAGVSVSQEGDLWVVRNGYADAIGESLQVALNALREQSKR